MRARILPPEEWVRIKDTELSMLLPYVPKEHVAIVVVEDDAGEIVARWCVFQATHFEGIWIDPRYRGNAGVIRPLLRYAFALPVVRGERWAFSGAETNGDGVDRVVDHLLRRLGGRPVPMQLYAFPVSRDAVH